MPWPSHRCSAHELELERKCETLSIKLLRANAALRLKTIYAERLEYLLHERLTRIDELTGTIDLLRQQNKKLDAEAEHLAAMVADERGMTAEADVGGA